MGRLGQEIFVCFLGSLCGMADITSHIVGTAMTVKTNDYVNYLTIWIGIDYCVSYTTEVYTKRYKVPIRDQYE